MSHLLDDRDLYGGLIRMHILHHANEEAIYGQGMIEELRRHGYAIGPGTMYPLLHGLEKKGYLLAKRELHGSRYRTVYRITGTGRKVLFVSRQRVQELFGEMFEDGHKKLGPMPSLQPRKHTENKRKARRAVP
jgi:DNA-binding PadR family transcriptional regulator